MIKHALVVTVLLGTVPALAQPGTPAPSDPLPPTPTTDSSAALKAQPGEEKPAKKEPGRGDFDAGGQVRLPSGPDEAGQYAAFNWIALDLKGRYFLLDGVTLNGN